MRLHVEDDGAVNLTNAISDVLLRQKIHAICIPPMLLHDDIDDLVASDRIIQDPVPQVLRLTGELANFCRK